MPSARSGHRMVLWKSYIVLFGGFYEAMREVRWFNDLYMYSFQENRWSLVSAKAYAPAPRPRSGFQMCLHPTDDLLYIYGGYSKEKQIAANPTSSVGNKKEAKIHDDMWCVNLKQMLASENQGSVSKGGAAEPIMSSAELLRNKGNSMAPVVMAALLVALPGSGTQPIGRKSPRRDSFPVPVVVPVCIHTKTRG